MSQPFDGPMFCVGNAICVDNDTTRVGAAADGAAILRLLERSGDAGASVGENHVGVRRMNCLIAAPVKNNRANAAAVVFVTIFFRAGAVGAGPPRIAANAETMSVAAP